MYRSVLFLAIFACSFCKVSAVWAGSWSGPFYTGGHLTASVGSVFGPYNYLYGTGTGRYGAGSYQFTDPSGPTVVDCQGTVTATWLWDDSGDPEDTPPKKVLLREHATANWGGDALAGSDPPSGSLSCSGSASNGLGNPEVTDDTNLGFHKGGTSDGTRVRVMDVSGYSFSCSVTMSASFTGQIGDPGIDGGAYCYYDASIQNCEILRNGARIIGQNKRVLPGEPNYMTVSVGSTSYSWSVQGNTFLDWPVDTIDPDDPDNSPVFVRAVRDFNNPNFYFFFTSGSGNKRVDCTINIPDCQNNPVSVSEELNLAQPVTSTLTNDWGKTSTGDARLWPNSPAIPTHVGLMPDTGPATPGATTLAQTGVYWNVEVGIPSGWQQGGELANAQLRHPNLSIVKIPGLGFHHRRNGGVGLDTLFPYTGDVRDGLKLEGGDTPSITLSNLQRASYRTEVFTTCLMFKPSMEGSQWVPLKQMSWGYTTDATLNSVWSLTDAGKYKSSWLSLFSHPEWEYIVLANDFVED